MEDQFEIEDIVSVEQLDDFNDEYVYDVEVEDLHTFIGNDILLHNSIYVEFGRLVNFFGIPKENADKFCVDLWNEGLGPFLDECFDSYAKFYNCDKNLEVLELEKIARTGIFTAKKHYAMEESWKEPNIYLKPMEETLVKGLEVIQGSTPAGARKLQNDFIKYCLNWFIDHSKAPDYKILVGLIKKYKQEFLLMEPDSICKGSSLSNYEKFVLDDKNNFVIKKGTPIHVNGAAAYNFTLNQEKNKKYRLKYNFIKAGDKVKFFKTKDPKYPVFSYIAGNFPLEFAPKINIDAQFTDLVLAPINRLIVAMGMSPVNGTLTFSNSLF